MSADIFQVMPPLTADELADLAPGDEEFLAPLRRHLYQPRLDLLLTVSS